MNAKFFRGIFAILLLSSFFHSNTVCSQTRNLYVEGNGDQYGVIHALSDGTGAVGSAGIELIRGGNAANTDWRIVNIDGNLRFQSGTDNFNSNGSNYVSILENGYVGIGCSNPQAKLSICGGQIAFSNGFSESQADKISLDGYRFDQPDMVGIGYETSVVTGGSGSEELSDLYFKAEGSHRWYNNTNADVGASASMVLNPDGYLGIGIRAPKRTLDVVRDIRITRDGAYTPTLEFYDPSSIQVKARIKQSIESLKIQAYYNTDIDLTTSSNDTEPSRIKIKANNGYVGVGEPSPATRLHIDDGTDASYAGGGFLQIGDTDDKNISIDDNEILARSDGGESPLYIQQDGGDLLLCGNEMGQVGIGITSPVSLPDASFLLAVDGKIISEEVRVEMSGDWPDYVFEKEYPLLSIPEFAQSIKENGHLPGIPSAEEMGNHQDVGKMQLKMMEKIEELSLYIIQLESRLAEIENKPENN